MRRFLLLAATLSLTAATAHAQACLSVNDGVGGVHLTCPDGRTGFLTNSGAGVLAGMVGNQPYTTPATNMAPPLGLPSTTPGATFVAPPLTAPQVPQYVPPAPPLVPYTPPEPLPPRTP